MAPLKRTTDVPAQPSAQQIAERAHALFLQRGATPGRELDDWLAAERELSEGATMSPATPPKRRRTPATSSSRHPRARSQNS